jgi:hypothetical protein
LNWIDSFDIQNHKTNEFRAYLSIEQTHDWHNCVKKEAILF